MDWSTIILIVSLLPYNAYSAGVLIDPILTRETGSFLQHMTGIGENLISCTATFIENDKECTFVLDIKSTSITKPDNFNDENNLSSRLSSLGQNLCGFKVVNVSTGDPKAWTLASIDAFDNYNEAAFNILVWDENADEMYEVVTVTLGMTQVISCGLTDGSFNKDYCKIFNPAGELVSSSACTYSVVVTMADLGKWRCLAAVVYSMDPLEFITEVISTDGESTISWATETEDYHNIGCQIINYKSTTGFSYCVMTSPKGDDYVIRTGKATGRYNTITTDLSKLICGMEIPKPLQDDEYGVWRCKIGNRGKALHISNTTDTDLPQLDYEKHITLSTSLGANVEIVCEVPYASVYCHIITPNGEIRKPQTTVEFAPMGQCIFTISTVLPEHIGTWICVFAQEGHLLLDEIEVEVLITDLLVYSKELSVSSGESLDIIFKNSGNPGVPLQNCLCLTPQNVSYYIYETLDTPEVTYIGEGFNYGDCSIRLNEVSSRDFGNWTCTIHLNQGGTVSGSILISAESILSETTTAIIIAVAVIFGLALVLLVAVVAYKLRRRRVVGNIETVVFDRNQPQLEPEVHRRSGPILTPVHPSDVSAELRQRR